MTIQKMPDKFLPLFGHLEELRKKLISCAVAWAIGTMVAWNFKDRLFEFFVRPVGQLVFLTPTGAFTMYLKLAAMAGLVLAMPAIVWYVWSFAAPALKETEFKMFLKYGLASFGLFCAGVVAGWLLVNPSVIYLMDFQSPMLVPMITVEAYSSFVVMLVVGCGVIFELPLIFLWLSHLGLVSSYWLIEQWRFAVLGSVVAAGVVTPTVDPVMQVIVALPILVLYTVSVACVRMGENRRARSMMMTSEAS